MIPLDKLVGLYYGSLNEDEKRDFEIYEETGIAAKSYDGPGGILGLSKIVRTGMQPKWCPSDDIIEDPCQFCGATESGNDKRRGVCGSKSNRPKTDPGFQIVLKPR